MNRFRGQLKKIIEYILPWLVLVVLVTYSYAKFYMHSDGFRWNANGVIEYMFVYPQQPTLKVGDQLVRVGPVAWDDFHADLRKTFFNGAKSGDIVPIVVERGGQTVTIHWTYPGFNLGDFYDQLPSEWLIAYFFWIAGLLTLLHLRPKDERWSLLLAFDFLTAIWLIAGSGNSSFHTLYSALVLRTVIWLCVPVYMHLNWVFPVSLGRLPQIFIWAVYGIILFIAIAQVLQLLPQGLYYLGFLIAILGSLTLLVVHMIRQPESRRDLAVLITMVFLALAPSIAVGIAQAVGNFNSDVLNLGLLAYPLLPFAYLYSAYRRQLGDMEVRVNRLISVYSFMVLLGILAIPLFVIVDRWLPPQENTLIVGTTSALAATVLTLWLFPRFQHFMEQRLLGIPVAPEQIQEVYSNYTSARTSINALVDLLKEVMLPSLLVRQFLFVQFDRESIKVILSIGLDEEQVPSARDLSRLSALKDDLPGDTHNARPYPWVRLVLPLKVGNDVLGLWLLGRRDPDDFYSQRELPMLQSLANQTAITLSNVIQTERLHAAYQDGIKRSEDARKNMALELHDGILNKMAALMMMLDDHSITPEFQRSYNELTSEVREMVKDLRPTMLNYGLKLAIEGYTDTLADRSDGKVRFIVDLKAVDDRYSPDVEQHVFRILEESTMNALRHAHPTQVTISGKLETELIEINIEDNGSGFNPNEKMDLNALQAGNHFGMSGIFERAELIGAEIKIESEPSKGTRLQIYWKPGRG